MNRSCRLLVFLFATFLPCLFAGKAQTLPGVSPWNLGSLAPTPMMGWANWNAFFCDYTDQTIRQQADALVKTGMRDAGYRYVIIQECIAPGRDAQGNQVVDAARFPQGMKPLVDYIHSLGLKAGIYTDVGKRTCFPKIKYEGSYGHEQQDANTFASWGMDFVEMDYCFREPDVSGREIYEKMAKAIQDTGRPMVFYLCSWGNEQPWEWAQGKAQGWRTENDISFAKNSVSWDRMLRNFRSNQAHAVMSAPESWNDADMLEVGNHGISDEEAQTHMTMWAIAPSVLLAGTDLVKMSPHIQSIYTNKEVIAVNQDPLGAGAEMLQEVSPGVEIWVKPLHSRTGGDYAVMLLNATVQPASVSIAWSQLDLLPSPKVRDLWAHKDQPANTEAWSGPVAPHGAVLLRVNGRRAWKRGVVTEAEWPGVARSGAANLFVCAECSHGYAIAVGGSAPGAIIFSNLDTDAGDYILRFHYVRSGTELKTASVTVNGVAIEARVERKNVDSFDVRSSLKSGKNEVTLSFGGKLPLIIDRLDILRASSVHDGVPVKQADPYRAGD